MHEPLYSPWLHVPTLSRHSSSVPAKSTPSHVADCPGPKHRRVGLLGTMRAHTNAPYKPDLLWETLRALKRPRWARTVPPSCATRPAMISALEAAFPTVLSLALVVSLTSGGGASRHLARLD